MELLREKSANDYRIRKNTEAELVRLKAENEALWDMVDDFNEAVQKAVKRLP